MTLRTAVDRASAPLGDLQTQLLWRLFGLAIYQEFPLEVGWVPLSGLVLVVLGPRLVTLLFTATVMWVFLGGFASSRVELSLPEELGLFSAVPTAALALSVWLLARGRDADRRVAAAHAGLFRVAALGVMGFAAFHKLNTDFLLADGGCTGALVQRLDNAWHVPIREWRLTPSPWHVIAAEGTSPVLLLLYPLFGIAFTIAIMTPLGLFGPTALTTTVFALAFGFLRAGDAEAIVRIARERAGALAALLAVAGVTAYALYAGQQPFRIVFYLMLVVALLSVLGLVGVERMRADGWSTAVRPRWPARILAEADPSTKFALIAFAALVAVNGFLPYLGIKYRMSFAMFSNLRVDSARWNHLLVPEALQPEADGYVHVTRVDLDENARLAQSRLPRAKHRALTPALLTPMSLAHRLDVLRRTGGSADVELSYHGTEHRFEDVGRRREIDAFLAPLPRHKLFQPKLAIDGPQACVH